MIVRSVRAKEDKLDEVLPLNEAFRVLRSLSDQRLILGLDAWRQPIGHDSLYDIDSKLADIARKQPPTKYGHVASPSLWTAVHFYLSLPALSYTLKKYGREDKKTRQLMIQAADLQTLFVTFPHIWAHYCEYQELKNIVSDPSKQWWDEVLAQAFRDASTGKSATSLLQELPDFLRSKAQSVLSGSADSLTGRIVLAYLLGQGVEKSSLPFDISTESFLATASQLEDKTLYARLVTAQQSLEELTPYLASYDPAKGLRLDNLLEVVNWYGRPHLVEMMIPGLVGAEAATIRSLSALFAKIIENGGPDYTAPPVPEMPTIQQFRATQSLVQIGRLSLVKDLLSTDDSQGNSEGSRLRHLVRHVYSRDERNSSWGNPVYYIPDHKRDFESFRQDIANIIFCAGLYQEHATMASRSDPVALKLLARRVSSATSFNQIRALVNDARKAVNDVAIEWQVRCPDAERTRILHFLCQTFGLEQISPIPIPLAEINKAFAGSVLAGRHYQIKYMEAGEKLTMTVPLARKHNRVPVITYRTNPGSSPRTLGDGLPYNAWLEVSTGDSGDRTVTVPVPGRGSVDPFGRTGSPHGGEAIGFGCSVHHASLMVLLGELAALGASSYQLLRVTKAFMRINKKMHVRHEFAQMQVSQVIAAVYDGRELTAAQYLQTMTAHVAATGVHKVKLLESSQLANACAWAQPQIAKLALGYPDLYPYHAEYRVDPRISWYDGATVSLPSSNFHWRAVST